MPECARHGVTLLCPACIGERTRGVRSDAKTAAARRNALGPRTPRNVVRITPAIVAELPARRRLACSRCQSPRIAWAQRRRGWLLYCAACLSD